MDKKEIQNTINKILSEEKFEDLNLASESARHLLSDELSHEILSLIQSETLLYFLNFN
jgi:hypothetical protein